MNANLTSCCYPSERTHSIGYGNEIVLEYTALLPRTGFQEAPAAFPLEILLVRLLFA